MTRNQTIYIKFFIFLTGLVTLVLELTASRLLAPYFGSSIFVWANIIGLILLALALGYWLGGRLADQKPEYTLLMKIVLLAGIGVSFIPWLFKLFVPVIIGGFGQISYSLIFTSFIMIVLLFFLPTLLLGLVSPLAVRLINQSVSTTGRSAGSLYAWSTAGSILGTFITAFLAVPLVGTQATIFLAGFILIFLGAVGLKKPIFYIFVLLPIGLYLLLNIYTNHFENGLVRQRTGVLYEKETPYQFIQVVEADGVRKLITDSGFCSQTIYRSGEILTQTYYDYFALLPPLIKKPGEDLEVLIIGLAGGSISRLYDEIYSNDYDLKMTGVELDPGMIEAGQKYFDLNKYPINIEISDGRAFLNQSQKTYDLIIIDAYENQLNIPFHLITQEFFQLTAKHLSAQGLVGVNINAASRDSKLLTSFLATIASVYPNVYVIPVEDSFNYLVVGSHQPLDFSKPDYPQILDQLVAHSLSEIEQYQPSDRRRLTDDWAPVELLTDSMYFKYIWYIKS